MMNKTDRGAFILFLGIIICSCTANPTASQRNQAEEFTNQAQTKLWDENPFLDNHQAINRNVKLNHISLKIQPDWESETLTGAAGLFLKAQLDDVQQFEIDAKAFDIDSINFQFIRTNSVQWEYDNLRISFQLEKPIMKNEEFNIHIYYTAQPSRAALEIDIINESNKGLYFVQESEYANHGQQVWTHGQPQSNSVWFPTIEDPAQRMTQELWITIPDAMSSVSNGQLVYTLFEDNLRTDYWKLDKPHAPYLSMFAAGYWDAYHDTSSAIPLTFYADQAYQGKAFAVFQNTAKMITFLEDRLGVPFPWENYKQIVVKDFVSGAMENTTASVFMEEVVLDSATLKEEDWDTIVIHELMHQWFGNEVAVNDWSQIALNESMASYAEYLWIEHHKGKMEADFHMAQELEYLMDAYLDSAQSIIRYHYRDEADLFDAFSYQKGAWALHMLRNYLGDQLFFQSLQYYLTRHAQNAVDVHDLRKAFEQVSGQDLKWFFYQWFERAELPIIQLDYYYDTNSNNLFVYSEQLPENENRNMLFKIPMSFCIVNEDSLRITKPYWISHQYDTLAIPMQSAPDLVYPNPDQSGLVLLKERLNIQKAGTIFGQAKHFLPKYMAALYINDYFENGGLSNDGFTVDTIQLEKTYNLLKDKGLNDSFWYFRQFSLTNYFPYAKMDTQLMQKELIHFAHNDPSPYVRSNAIILLAEMEYGDKNFYQQLLLDSTASVKSVAIYALLSLFPEEEFNMMKQYGDNRQSWAIVSLLNYHASALNSQYLPWAIEQYPYLSSMEKAEALPLMGQLALYAGLEQQQLLARLLRYEIANSNKNYLREMANYTFDYLTEIDK